MTTTVRVQARAWGARVEREGQEPVELEAHQDMAFHVEEGESATFTVTQGDAPADRANEMLDEEVPGRTQNDELLGHGGSGKTARGSRAAPATGNQSGADETAQTTS